MRFDDTNLPSRMIPYNVKGFEMTPFRVPQIMKMSRAMHLDSVAPMVEALDEVLDIDAATLTDGDFYYLLAYQRLVNYDQEESPLQAIWECSSTLFHSEDENRTYTHREIRDFVDAYIAASEDERKHMTDPATRVVTTQVCGHRNVHSLTMDDLAVMRLDSDLKLDPDLDFPRVGTLADAIARASNPDEAALIQAARWVKAGSTLDAKMDILVNQDNLNLFQKCLRADTLIRHGISRILRVPCEKCGHPADHQIDITPQTFFDV